MTELLVAERVTHPYWGARKLLTVLQTKHPRIREWPPPPVRSLISSRGAASCSTDGCGEQPRILA